jgi:CubicO group peptidase (beta-lactamase class C family)
MVHSGVRRALRASRGVALALGVACLITFAGERPQAASAAGVQARIDKLIRGAIAHHGIRAVIFQATVNGRLIMSKAYGSSMTGVPATTRMHFRNGAVEISYMSTLLLRLVDEGRVKLSDKVSKWLPKLRDSHRRSR